MPQSSCDTCMNLYYDDETDSWECGVSVDEDEYVRFLSDKSYSCPYYRMGDDYTIVRKQN